jgi:hypothetical protein
MEVCLVKVLWLLEKSPHFLVGPTCHTQVQFSSSFGHPTMLHRGGIRVVAATAVAAPTRWQGCGGGLPRAG